MECQNGCPEHASCVRCHTDAAAFIVRVERTTFMDFESPDTVVTITGVFGNEHDARDSARDIVIKRAVDPKRVRAIEHIGEKDVRAVFRTLNRKERVEYVTVVEAVPFHA